MSDSLSKEQAVRAVAQMLNTLAVEPVEALLADEIHYEVQWHLHGPSGVWLPFDIYGKDDFISHMTGLLAARKAAGQPLFAEVGHVADDPCLVVADGAKDALVATVLVDVVAGKIRHLEFGLTPAPSAVERSGEYPG